jgi:hypothetical protein
MMSLILASVLAAPDAGLPSIYGKCPDGPPLVPVAKCAYGACEVGIDTDGGFTLAPLDWPFEDEQLGYVMSFKRSARLACFVGACEKSRELVIEAHANEDAPVPWQVWAAGLGVAFGLGLAAGRLIRIP